MSQTERGDTDTEEVVRVPVVLYVWAQVESAKMIEFDELDRKLLQLNGVPDYIIDIIEEWTSDIWHDGYGYGEGDC